MRLKNNATYQFISRADPLRALNVYGSSGSVPSSQKNVCLYKSNPKDTCQQWVYKEVGGHKYLVCKNNQNLALDMYTGSPAAQNMVNAHVYAPSNTSYLGIVDTDSGYVKIHLTGYANKFLTANQGNNGDNNGRTTHDPGNVYWYKDGLTDHSQEWKPIPVDGGGSVDPDPQPGSKVVVTGMPACWAYSNNREYFHPDSGMVAGDFYNANNGLTILSKIKNFYETVFHTTVNGNVDAKENMDKYGYSFYGSETVTNDKFNGTYHLGVDMTCYRNAPVYSYHEGELLYANGNRVAIYDKQKNVTYLYLHTLIDNSILNKGTEQSGNVYIKKGQLIGLQSNQGLSGSNNSHLHFEVKKGRDSVAAMPTNKLNNKLYPNLKPYDYM